MYCGWLVGGRFVNIVCTCGYYFVFSGYVGRCWHIHTGRSTNREHFSNILFLIQHSRKKKVYSHPKK